MGRIVTLRPNGVANQSGDLRLTPSSASLQSIVSDDSDSSYFRLGDPTDRNTARVRFSLATFLLASSERTSQAQLRYRVTHPDDIDFTYSLRDANLNTYFSAYRGAGEHTTPFERNSGWRSFTNKSQGEIDELLYQVQDDGGGRDRPTLYELYLDIETNYAPRPPLGIQPAGALARGVNLSAAWTPDDPEGDAQAGYQVKLFTANQFQASGFNPDSSTAYYDSGKVASSDRTVPLPSPLPGGSWRCYVWTKDAFGFGAPGYSAFTIAAQRQQMIL